jgi:hypothetical protein
VLAFQLKKLIPPRISRNIKILKTWVSCAVRRILEALGDCTVNELDDEETGVGETCGFAACESG